jgi:hypothetical protein
MPNTAKSSRNSWRRTLNAKSYDCDFLHDDIEKVAQANLIATIIDGEEVFTTPLSS